MKKPRIYFRDGRWHWRAKTSHNGFVVACVASYVAQLNARITGAKYTPYYPSRVTRPDAGGELYAPVRYVENEPVESGDTPSYDYAAVRRRCDELNRAMN